MSAHYGRRDAVQFLMALVGEDYPDYDLEGSAEFLWNRGRTYDIQDCDNATLREALAYGWASKHR